ncbi:MAG: hypothetical protein WBA40_08550, partial [Roseiarcus sp.]
LAGIDREDAVFVVALLEKQPRQSLLRKGRGGGLYRRCFALRLVRVKHLSENAGGSNFGQ